MAFMGPDPIEWAQRGSHPHVGQSLRRQRLYAKLEAADLAQVDGTWSAAEVLEVEQMHSIGSETFTRYRTALAAAVKLKQQGSL